MIVNISRRKKAEQELKKLEDRLKHVTSLGPTIIYTSKASGNYGGTFVSENVKNLTGYSAEDFVKNSEFWMENIHPGDKDLVMSKLSNISKEKNIGFEYRFKFKDEIYHWIRNESKLITDEKGNPVELIGSWTDITWSKKSEEKLRYQANLVENVSDAIISTDLNFNVITWNKAAELIYGWRAEEVIGKNFSEIIPLVYQDGNTGMDLNKLFKEGFWKGEVIQPHKDGTPIDILLSVSLIKDDKENPIGVVATNCDITERKKAEDQIKESEKRLKAFIEAVPAGISISTPDGEIIECNTQAFKIFGYDSKEEFFATPILEVYYDPNDRKKFIELHSKGLVKDFEVKVKRKDATVFWVSIISTAQRFNDQDVFINSYVDITERKNKEEELRLHSEIMANVSEGVQLARIDDGIIVYNNPALEEMFGYNPGELIGKDIAIINAPTDNTPEETKKTIKGILSETGEWHGEIKNIKKNGTVFWSYVNVSVFDHPDYGKVLVSVNTDITKRKKAQQKLIESEMRHRHLANELELIFDHLPGIIAYKDTENNLLRVNKFMADAHNLKKEDMEGKSTFEFYPKEEAQAYWEDDLEVIEGKEPKLNIIEPWETLDGRRWVNTSKIPYIDEDGNVKGIIVLAFDITDRIKAEQGLKESEEKYRTLSNQYRMLLESITDAVYALNRDWEYIIVNKNAEKIINMPVENLLGQKIFDVFPGIEETPFFKTYESVMNNRNATRIAESFTHPDGRVGYYEVSVYPINEGILCIAKDITEEKEIEIKLIESEEKFRMLFNNANDTIIIIDLEGSIIECNQTAYERLGYTKEELLQMTPLDIDTEKYVKKVSERINTTQQLGKLFFEVEHKRKDGSIIPVEINSKLINFNGKPAILSVARDITERKKAERKLIDSEERYRNLFENSPIALFEQDFSELKSYLNTLKDSGIVDFEKYFDENPEEILNCGSMIKIIDVNKKALEIYKVNSIEELVRRKNQIEKGLLRDVPPELLLVNKQELLSFINGDSTFESETVTKTLTGDVINLYMKTLIIPGFEKTWSKVIVSFLDITNRKRTEQKLRESEEKFRTIAEQSSIGVIIQQGGFIKFANIAVSEIVEYPMEEINNRAVENLYKMVYEEDLPLFIEKFKGRQTGDYESVSQFDLRLLSKLGKIKWVSIFSKPIIYLGKNAVLSTLIDITAKKRVEEELKEVTRLKSDLLSRTSHELKTPLVSIKGYADLLLSQHYNELDFYTISVLHEIKQGCSRLESLIKDLLETSKLESGEIKLNKSEEDLTFLIRYCIRDLQGLIENRKHELIVVIQDNMVTLFEKEKIYEVFINLLSNSIKYTPSNGTIKINSEIRDNQYLISIIDDGIGLTEQEKLKIFKKFGKVERYGKGLDVISEGSGLGLYISKKIIELHEGNIWVESEGRHKGSTFYFSLPIIKN
jgi:PAS domain S-box-containing protein